MSSEESVLPEMTTSVHEKSIGDAPTTDLVSGDTERFQGLFFIDFFSSLTPLTSQGV
jgi:hypothetical protein